MHAATQLSCAQTLPSFALLSCTGQTHAQGGETTGGVGVGGSGRGWAETPRLYVELCRPAPGKMSKFTRNDTPEALSQQFHRAKLFISFDKFATSKVDVVIT